MTPKVTMAQAYEMLLAEEHREEMLAWEGAAARLRKLTVAELRVLYRHYFKCSPIDMDKGEIIEELAPALVEDGR